MLVLPKVEGQSLWTAGRGTEVSPVRKAMRQASMAGQSAPSRTSFQTPAP